MEPVFDTRALAAPDRATAWLELVEQSFAGMRVLELGDAVNGQVRAAQSPELTILDITSSAMRAREDPPPGGPDLVYVAQIHDGECNLVHGGHATRLQPGQFTLIDARRRAQLELDDETRFTLLLLPRERVTRHVPLVDGAVGRVSNDSASDRHIAASLRSFTEAAGGLTSSQRSIALRSLLHLLPAASAVTAEDGPATSRWLARAAAVIEQRLHDPAFGPDPLAEAVGVSRRYLDKLFAGHGSSIAREIWERRLRRAAHDLRAPAYRHRTIAEIAYGAGFSDAAHFTRAFRRRFGTTPSAFRRSIVPTVR